MSSPIASKGIVSEDAVHHERVDVHVEIQRRTERLHNRYGAGLAMSDALATRAAQQPREDDTEEGRGHRPAQRVVERQPVP